jgi:ComF family protein
VLATASNHIIRAILGPICAACERALDAPLDGALCADCRRDVHPIPLPVCRHCGDHTPEFMDERCARCRASPSPVSMARSAGVYDGALRDMIHALKYKRRRMIAPWLAARMACDGAAVLDDADAVVPVPLHVWREWRRGFNQADDLAIDLGLPVWRVLRRHRRGPPQASLPAAARHANTRGAYRLSRRESLTGRQRLSGAVLVLIDDVMTTGATLQACAEVLRRAGAADVRALTAARAVAGQPPRSRPTHYLSTTRR